MKRLPRSFQLWLCLLLAACSPQTAPGPAAPTRLPAYAYQPVARLLIPAQAGKDVVTAGYYYLVNDEAVLVDGLSFAGEKPQPLDARPAQQLWLGKEADATMSGALRESGNQRYTPVLATGRLEGPSSYGPDGQYAYELTTSHLTPLMPPDLTVASVLSKTFTYDGQFVRVSGVLLARPDSALLVDRLDAGGLPPPGALQIKLTQPFRDRALWERLTSTPGGVVHSGPVAVEGFWRQGVLTPLGIFPGNAVPSTKP